MSFDAAAVKTALQSPGLAAAFGEWLRGPASGAVNAVGSGVAHAARRVGDFFTAPDDPQRQRVLQYLTAQNNKDTLRTVAGLGIGALGVGAAARGAAGLYNQLSRDAEPQEQEDPRLVPLPYPTEALPAKAASFDWIGGGNAVTTGQHPLLIPGATLAVLGGGALGYKGVDALLDARRKAEREQQLEQERQNFQKSLLSLYPQKVAALDAALDGLEAELAGHAAKRASIGELSAGPVVGLGLTYAALAGLAGAGAGYNYAQRHSQRAVLDRAVAEREKRRALNAPDPLYAVPVAVPRPGGALTGSV